MANEEEKPRRARPCIVLQIHLNKEFALDVGVSERNDSQWRVAVSCSQSSGKNG